MKNLIRCITEEGAIAAIAIDSTQIVREMERIHKTSAVTSAALGRLLTAASMMGSLLKGEQESITLRVSGDGPAGTLIAVSDFAGNVRGYVSQPVVELPLNHVGKLDVGKAVGKNGFLYVMKDLGFGDPYIGQTPLVSGEIAEDIAQYYVMSEQVPTVCALGVLVNPDLTIQAAGGFLIQLLPGALESDLERLEQNVQRMEPITVMLAKGMTPEAICRKALEGFSVQVLDTMPAEYRCNCTKERVERALLSLGAKDLRDLAQEQPETEVQCHFCEQKYRFTQEDLLAMLENAHKESVKKS